MSGPCQFLARHLVPDLLTRGFGALTPIISTAMLVAAQRVPATNPTNATIPFAELGVKASAQYQGDGLSVQRAREGARLRCLFQKLEGEATAEGLWLISTADGAKGDRFRVVATSVGRENESTVGRARHSVRAAVPPQDDDSAHGVTRPTKSLAHTGVVAVVEKLARFVRPGLVEEYSVSVDGVRQDFIIDQRPCGQGPLRVELDVSGAKVETMANGAQLVLENSGRKIAYSRLRVTDATGKELIARMEVMGSNGESQRDSIAQPRVANLRATLGQAHPQVTTLTGLRRAARPDHHERCDATPLGLTDAWRGEPSVARRTRNPGLMDAIPSGLFASTTEWQTKTGPDDRAPMLAVVVEDADAVYPVRIDPTFSDANWISMNPSILGANDQVKAAVVDGSGNLYIGGYFTLVGDVIANHIAKWDGSSWSALGSGMNASVNALTMSGSDLYAGGDFTTAGGSAANFIARWNGSSWSALGSGITSTVNALAVSGSDLYAGGYFTTGIAKWNGSSWSALGSGMNREVNALAVSGSDLYAGGNFNTAGGSPAKSIAKWNGSTWSALGSWIDGGVYALAVSGSDLYAGGNFAHGIAKWDGSSWTALSSGLSGGSPTSVYALAVSGSDVFAGGSSGGSAANYIAKWNGSSWTTLGSGITSTVNALAVSGSEVYAGGSFTTAGGSAANNIAKWNGSSWSALGWSGTEMNGSVYALAVSGSDLYAGGAFTTAGGSAANYIAKWNGSSWAALGSGMNSTVAALAVSGSDVYAGGSFTTAGGSAANGIAKWSGSSWSALGSGMGGIYHYVSTLAVSGSNVYAGGSFTTAGGIAANNVAKWDGSSWTALGSGITAPPGGLYPGGGSVSALAVSGSDVYAGGYFNTAGDSPAQSIAKWNGSSWSALGSGIGPPPDYPPTHVAGRVFDLAVSGSDLYAGGLFTTAGGNAAYGIAKWNGSSWSALGSVSGPVYALAVSGSDLYAGGYFTMAGRSAANNIAKWDGSSWSPLGSGMGGGGVSALAVSGSDLYAGGAFATAGGKVSAYLAKADLLLAAGTAPALTLTRTSGNAMLVLWPSSFTDFTLQQNLDLNTTNWVTPSETVNSINSVNYIIVDPPSGNRFYRLFKP